MNEQFYENLKEKIKPPFLENGGHGFDHTQRVCNNALKISDEYVDLDVVQVSALLHDIARHKEDIGEVECHAIEGAKMAEEILKELDFPEDKIPFVVEAIKAHRYSKGIKAETREAEILQDADRLDALGAICVARVFSYNGKKRNALYDPEIKPMDVYDSNGETGINHFYEKILKITPDKFNTLGAQKIAEGRYNFVQNFVNTFKKEWEGEL